MRRDFSSSLGGSSPSIVSSYDGGRGSTNSKVQQEPVKYIHDLKYFGMEAHTTKLCKCNSRPHRYVAFEGMDLGRRFLGCAREDEKRCTFTAWVGNKWPGELKRAISKLWFNWEQVENKKDDEIWTQLAIATAQLEEERIKLKEEMEQKVLEMEKKVL